MPQTNPPLYTEYQKASQTSQATNEFFRNSSRYPLSAVGKLNTYQIFSGLVRQVAAKNGRVGVIVPSGIATDYYNQEYFNAIVEERELVSLYDFENREKLFPEVDSRMKFILNKSGHVGTCCISGGESKIGSCRVHRYRISS